MCNDHDRFHKTLLVDGTKELIYADPAQLAGMRELVRMLESVDRLTFSGNCPRIKHYLMEARPKAKQAASTSSRTNEVRYNV